MSASDHRPAGTSPTDSTPDRSSSQNSFGPPAPGNRQPIPTIAIGSRPADMTPGTSGDDRLTVSSSARKPANASIVGKS